MKKKPLIFIMAVLICAVFGACGERFGPGFNAAAPTFEDENGNENEDWLDGDNPEKRPEEIGNSSAGVTGVGTVSKPTTEIFTGKASAGYNGCDYYEMTLNREDNSAIIAFYSDEEMNHLCIEAPSVCKADRENITKCKNESFSIVMSDSEILEVSEVSEEVIWRDAGYVQYDFSDKSMDTDTGPISAPMDPMTDFDNNCRKSKIKSVSVLRVLCGNGSLRQTMDSTRQIQR